MSFRCTSPLLRAATTMKSISEHGAYIKGQIVPGTGEKFPVVNPADGTQVSLVTSASREDVQQAIQQAHETFMSGVWSRAAPADRASVLQNIARLFSERIEELAELETLQTGRAIREMKTQLGRLPEWFDYFAGIARTHEGAVAPTRGSLLNYTKRVPLGVVAQITPFNHPLLISVKKLAPALAAGNSVIVKPSELAPLSVLELAKITREAGLPDGVLSVLPGFGATTGKDIVEHPLIKKVDLTGGTEAGRVIGSIVGGNLASYTAELGGKAPVIVFGDADIQASINGVLFASFVASGQTCVSGTRILIDSSIYSTIMPQLISRIRSITQRMGSPQNPQSMMGPVISAKQLAKIAELVQIAKKEGGQVLVGGERLQGKSPLDGADYSKGFFFPPTVIQVEDTNLRVWKEEIFGPVIVVKKFDGEDEAVKLANDCEFGLGSAIWTKDGARGIRVSERIEAGLVWINCHHRNDPSSPWGGMKSSGIGRENGHEAYHAYTQSKSVIINYATDDANSKDNWFAEEGRSAVRYG